VGKKKLTKWVKESAKSARELTKSEKESTKCKRELTKSEREATNFLRESSSSPTDLVDSLLHLVSSSGESCRRRRGVRPQTVPRAKQFSPQSAGTRQAASSRGAWWERTQQATSLQLPFKRDFTQRLNGRFAGVAATGQPHGLPLHLRLHSRGFSRRAGEPQKTPHSIIRAGRFVSTLRLRCPLPFPPFPPPRVRHPHHRATIERVFRPHRLRVLAGFWRQPPRCRRCRG